MVARGEPAADEPAADEPAADEPAGSWRRRAGALLDPYVLAVLVLATLLPFLGFLNVNRDRAVTAGAVLGYAAAVLVVVLALQLALLLVIRRADPRRLASVLAVVVTSFFLYSAWASFARQSSRLATFVLWVVVTGLAATAVYRVARFPAFRQWAVATLAIVCLVSTSGYVLAGGGGSPDAASSAEVDGLSPDDAVRRPDIYYFLLDAYARNDTLDEVMGVDNGSFHDELRARGFEVADEALASYPVTFLSTMATFEMGYPADESADLAADLQSFDRYIKGDNALVEQLRALGYSYVYSHGGPFSFSVCDEQLADVCIPPDTRGGAMGEVELSLIELTPIGSLGLFTGPRTDPGYVLDRFEELEIEEPTFLFSHVIAPHHPYIYDDACELRDERLSKASLSVDEERAAYANEVRCLNAEVLAAIDRIIDDDPDAIVVLSSDHGSELLSDWSAPLEEWTDLQLQERFGVQNALRLPEPCRGHVARDTPLVHDFSIVLACLEGREPELTPYRGFFWTYDAQTTLEEIPDDRLTGG